MVRRVLVRAVLVGGGVLVGALDDCLVVLVGCFGVFVDLMLVVVVEQFCGRLFGVIVVGV